MNYRKPFHGLAILHELKFRIDTFLIFLCELCVLCGK